MTMTLAATSTHPTAIELLRAYLDNIQDPDKIASLFAEDGVIELPPIKMRAQGPDTIRGFLQGLLTKVPTFGFKNTKVWIETPDKVFAEYSVEALVADTGKTYRQTYSGLLIAENGRIKLIREALDTAEAARAFSKD
jgi:ketosteroid isomerase-like protein